MSTLVWGLDKDYENNKGWIESNFVVEGYYDSNNSKIPKSKGIKREELKEKIKDFDNVLVCADPPSIVTDLVENYNVPIERIKILFYELIKKENAYITFHGENNEDSVIMLLLKIMNIPFKRASYLEIGTNDPVRNNNSFALYKNGAKGTIVDAFPMVGELAKMVRPRDQFINCAVSNVSGGNAIFYTCESSAFSSLSEKHHKQYDNMRPNGVKEISVPVLGINELINMCDNKPNILLCDAEGYDELIVESIDYSNNDFAIIMFETGHSESSEGKTNEILEKNGYKLFSCIKQNLIYYNTDILK